jgi:peptide deformylase
MSTVIPIVQKENPVLRAIAKPVDFKNTPPAKLKKIIADMTVALNSQDDGVAIAAPQIGLSLRMFVVSHKVFEMIEKKSLMGKDLVCINPKVIKLSKKKVDVEEGCLSVRWLYGKVSRSLQATIAYHDEHGKLHTLGASGLLAQIFQHETDHLNGVLFIDTAKDLEDIPPETQTHDK